MAMLLCHLVGLPGNCTACSDDGSQTTNGTGADAMNSCSKYKRVLCPTKLQVKSFQNNVMCYQCQENRTKVYYAHISES